MKYSYIIFLLLISLNAISRSISEIETVGDISSQECLEVLEYGNIINIIDGIYPVIIYKGHSYFIQTS